MVPPPELHVVDISARIRGLLLCVVWLRFSLLFILRPESTGEPVSIRLFLRLSSTMPLLFAFPSGDENPGL